MPKGKMTLGQELWKRIETAQGYAFISDAVEELPDSDVIRIAERALHYSEKSTRILRYFLRKHENVKK